MDPTHGDLDCLLGIRCHHSGPLDSYKRTLALERE